MNLAYQVAGVDLRSRCCPQRLVIERRPPSAGISTPAVISDDREDARAAVSIILSPGRNDSDRCVRRSREIRALSDHISGIRIQPSCSSGSVPDYWRACGITATPVQLLYFSVSSRLHSRPLLFETVDQPQWLTAVTVGQKISGPAGIVLNPATYAVRRGGKYGDSEVDSSARAGARLLQPSGHYASDSPGQGAVPGERIRYEAPKKTPTDVIARSTGQRSRERAQADEEARRNPGQSYAGVLPATSSTRTTNEKEPPSERLCACANVEGTESIYLQRRAA
jgi:hypothetical protein